MSLEINDQGSEPDCLVCSTKLSYSLSISEANTGVFCRLLGLNSSSLLEYIQAASYCSSCIRRITSIGNTFISLDELEKQLEISRASIEEQIRRGLEEFVNHSGEANINSQVRGKIISELSSHSNASDALFHKSGLRIRESILPDIHVNLEHGYSRSPSPARSFASHESFEEKFDPTFTISEDNLDVEETIGVQPSSIKTEEFLRTDPLTNTSVHSKRESRSRRGRITTTTQSKGLSGKKSSGRKIPTSSRITCPFTPSCGVALNKNDEIYRDAHFKRLHEGLRDCYICKVCKISFTGYARLKSHVVELHPNYENECPSDDTNKPTNRTQTQPLTDPLPKSILKLSEEQSEISNSGYPLIILKPLVEKEFLEYGIQPVMYNRKPRYKHHMGPKSIKSFNLEGKRIKISYLSGEGTILNSEIVQEASKPKRSPQQAESRKLIKKKHSIPNRQKLPTRRNLLREKCPYDGCFRMFYPAQEDRKQSHIRKFHEGLVKPYQCSECKKSFRHKSHWEQHCAEHKGIPVHVCKYCQLDCKGYYNLRVHTLRVHEPEKIKYNCDQCPKKFVDKHKWLDHQLVHTKEKPFMCEVCSQTFKSPQYLKYHLKTHSDPIGCEDCGKTFTAPKSLRDHITNVHTKVYKLFCEQCGKGAQTEKELQRHKIMKHSEEANFKCHICPATFKLSVLLKAHVYRHVGEKKHKCKHCNKAFLLRSDVTRHEVIHLNGLNHVCRMCGEKFPVKNDLLLHMRTHNEGGKSKQKKKRSSMRETLVVSPPTEGSSEPQPSPSEINAYQSNYLNTAFTFTTDNNLRFHMT